MKCICHTLQYKFGLSGRDSVFFSIYNTNASVGIWKHHNIGSVSLLPTQAYWTPTYKLYTCNDKIKFRTVERLKKITILPLIVNSWQVNKWSWYSQQRNKKINSSRHVILFKMKQGSHRFSKFTKCPFPCPTKFSKTKSGIESFRIWCQLVLKVIKFQLFEVTCHHDVNSCIIWCQKRLTWCRKISRNVSGKGTSTWKSLESSWIFFAKNCSHPDENTYATTTEQCCQVPRNLPYHTVQRITIRFQCHHCERHSLRLTLQPIKNLLFVPRQPVNVQTDLLKCLRNWTDVLTTEMFSKERTHLSQNTKTTCLRWKT